jgi:hypothetical protein
MSGDSTAKNGQPRQEMLPAGAVVSVAEHSAKGPVSRILSCAVIPLGAALPRTLISDLPGGFGVLRTAAPCRAGVSADGSEPPERAGPMRSGAWLLARASLPIWSCSVWGLPCLRRYRRSGALLPHHFTLTPSLRQQAASGSPSRKRGSRGGIISVALAVHGF